MSSAMSLRDRLTLAGALAVALAAAALIPVYDGLGWVLRVLGAIAAVAGAAALARRGGAPRLLHPLAGLAGLAAYVCLVFARPTLAFLVVPTGDTLTLLSDLVRQALLDVEELAAPVPTRPGLVLLAVLGVGAIAVVVDLLAVSLRAAAVAGLPLLLLFAVPAAVLPDGLGWWPFALGAAGWLGLLLADGSDTVSRWGTPLRTGRGGAASDPGLGRVGRRIGAAALGVAVVVPAVLPDLDSQLFGGDGSGGFGNGSRSTTTYNPILELGGQLRQPEPGRLLMRYETNDPRPDYLRLTTLDRFDEATGWSSSELSADLQDDAVQPGIPAPLDASRVEALPIRTTIDIGRLDGPWLPTPSVPDLHRRGRPVAVGPGEPDRLLHPDLARRDRGDLHGQRLPHLPRRRAAPLRRRRPPRDRRHLRGRRRSSRRTSRSSSTRPSPGRRPTTTRSRRSRRCSATGTTGSPTARRPRSRASTPRTRWRTSCAARRASASSTPPPWPRWSARSACPPASPSASPPATSAVTASTR